MKKSILAVLSDLVIYNADGSVNVRATGERIAGAVESEIRDNASHDAAIEAALDHLFDSLPAGTAVKTPIAVQASAAALAGGDFAALVDWTARVESYLDRSQRFQGQRGRSGGLKRIG